MEELNTSLRAEYLRGGVTVCVSPLIFAFVLGAGIPRAMDVAWVGTREERKRGGYRIRNGRTFILFKRERMRAVAGSRRRRHGRRSRWSMLALASI